MVRRPIIFLIVKLFCNVSLPLLSFSVLVYLLLQNLMHLPFFLN